MQLIAIYLFVGLLYTFPEGCQSPIVAYLTKVHIVCYRFKPQGTYLSMDSFASIDTYWATQVGGAR